ncbi:MAG: p115 like vesicle tethering protein, partial [Olpidium bornovanus]
MSCLTRRRLSEGLLLLISLTHSNADIQKIIAFENAFERLLAIIAEQGGADGDIIVQDCLQLIHNLLRYNVSNQVGIGVARSESNFFRETNCIQRIPVILPTMNDDWPEQKVYNAVHLLRLIRVLVVPGNTTTVANQQFARTGVKLRTAGAIGGSSPLNSASDMRRSSAAGPPPGGEPATFEPAFLTLVSVATGDHRDEITTRAAAAYAFEVREALRQIGGLTSVFSLVRLLAGNCQCYVLQNADAQIALTSTLNATPEDNPNVGHEGLRLVPQLPALRIILSALLHADTSRKDPYRAWFAATMFAHMIWDNEQCKDLALGTSFGDVSSGEEPVSLLDTLGHKLQVLFRTGGDARVLVALMCQLSVWLYEHEPSVTNGAHTDETSRLVPTQIIEIITKSSNVDPLVQGMAAFLLGVVLEFNQDPQSPIPDAQLRHLSLTRVGADQFSNRINRLRDSRQLQQTAPFYQIGPERDTHGLPDLWFDYAFVEFFKKHAGPFLFISTVQHVGGLDAAAFASVSDCAAGIGLPNAFGFLTIRFPDNY